MEEPVLNGDPPRRDPVVAQGDLDEEAVGILVGIGPEDDVSAEHVVPRPARDEIGETDADGEFGGRAPVAGVCDAALGLGALTLGLGGALGVVGGPGGVDGDGVDASGDLEAQTHGGGDHEATTLRVIILAVAGVLVDAGACLVFSDDGHTGGDSGIEIVDVNGVGIVGPGIGAIEASGGNAADEVTGHW